MRILKFMAIWCSTCLVMRPRFEEIEKNLPWLETEDIDIDQKPELAKKFQAEKPPVFVFLDKNDEEFLRLEGEVGRKKLIEIIENNRNK